MPSPTAVSISGASPKDYDLAMFHYRPVRPANLQYCVAMKVLVIEDDHDTAEYVRRGLVSEGHNVEVASHGRQGLLMALDENFDVIVVDRMLPEIDGLSLVKAARNAGSSTPVLFLSAMGSVEHRVEGLTEGGNDYLAKPFAFSELSARVALLGGRKNHRQDEEIKDLRVSDLHIDLLSQKVTRAGQAIVLQPREYRLLCYLIENQDRVVTRTMLLEAVWDVNFDPKTNVVETQISRLRDKIDKPFAVPLIRTVRGSGYQIHA